MVAIALFALATRGWMLWDRSVQYARKAEFWYDRMNFSRNHVATSLRISQPVATLLPVPVPDWMKAKAKFFQIRVDYAERLHRKYRRAARFPWLTPEADSPEPSPSVW
jgi:hypothetical protein